MTGRIIALLGPESSGKTTLAQGLAEGLTQRGAGRCTWVPEWLRQWCLAQGRTPQPHEQADIALEQTRRIEAACREHDWVVADTTALMTAVYSQVIFGDSSLMPQALQWQRGVALTLVTDTDLPWQSDGFLRDGAHRCEPVRQALEEALTGAGVPWTRAAGVGPQRLQAALEVALPVALQVALPVALEVPRK